MLNKKWKVLLVEDDEDDYVLARSLLAGAGSKQFELIWAPTFAMAIQTLGNEKIDVALVDYDLGARNGLEFIQEISTHPHPPAMILLTGRGSYEVDVEAMKAGAADYLTKSEVTPRLLERSIRYAIERRQNEEALRRAHDELERRVQERTRELAEANARLEQANLSLRAEILERQMAEKALFEQEERLRSVITSAPVILWAVDKNGTITLMEGRGLGKVGLKAGELVGRSVETDLLDWGQVQEHIRLVLGGQELTATFSTGGSGEIIETHYSPHYGAQGEVAGVIAVSIIITERVQAEEQLRQQEARSRALANLSQVLAEAGTVEQPLMDTIVNQTGELLGDSCSLWLLANEGKVLVPGAFYHPDPSARIALLNLCDPAGLLVSSGLIGRVVRSGQPALVAEPSPKEWERLSHPQLKPFYDRFPTHSALIVPLRGQGQVLGVLGVSRTRPGQPYTPADQDFLQSLADRAALAIANARLFEDLQQELVERMQMEAELAEVQSRLVDSRESERVHLARELHDGPMQDLYAVSYQMKSLSVENRANGLDAAQLDDRLGQLQEMLRHIIQVLRNVAGELRPPTLAPFGLEKTIRSHADRFKQEHPELHLLLHLEPDGQLLPDRVRLALFRIYQQSLANVARHANASEVNVRLFLDEEQVCLEVEDDGSGFAVPPRWIDFVREDHLGLAGAAERAEAVGGTLKVESQPGRGTYVQVTVPLNKPA